MTANSDPNRYEAVLAVGLDERLIYVNRYIEFLTGRTRSDLLGTPLSSVLAPDAVPEGQGVRELSHRAMEESRQLGPAMGWVRNGQDTLRPVAECFAAPIRDRYGLINGAMIILRGVLGHEAS